jgi:hypothetical protein
MGVNQEAAYWLALLNTSQVKRQLAKRVIHRWCVVEQQSLAALFDLGAAEVADRLGLSHAEAAQVLAAGPDAAAQQAALGRLSGRGIGVITRVDAAYPDLLAERLPEERLPYFLFHAGDPENLTQPGVAVLGAAEPSREAETLIGGLSARLADEGHLLVGGYDRGVDRQALEAGRDAGAAITLVLPAGIETMGTVLQRLAPGGRADRVLALSPFAPTTPHSDALAGSRLCLIGALAEVLVLVAPDRGPDELPDLRDLFTLGTTPPSRRAVAWTGDRGSATRAWIEAGAQPFDGVEAGLAHVLARFGAAPVDAPKGGGVDDVPGVEPIEFHDADSAIEALGQTGRVPEALARRLREAKWDDDWENG